MNISTVNCSMKETIDNLITDEDGYYSIGDLEDNMYIVTPWNYDFTFVPNFAIAKIPKQ